MKDEQEALLQKGDFSMVRIKLSDIKIDRISQSSGIFTGRNMPYQWRHQTKVNEGFGHIFKENNNINYSVQIVHDRDIADMISRKEHP